MPDARRSATFPSHVLRAALAISAVACGDDTAGPGPTITFMTQPTTAIAGEVIEPAVEVEVRDASGRPIRGTVTLSLDPNPCGWLLAGGLTAELDDGAARFPDLTLDRVGRGYTLRASFGQASATSAPFDVQSSVTTEPVHLEQLLCLKPNPQNDGESLTYIPEDDAFWIADDDRNSIFEVERLTGRFVSRIHIDDILQALPEAGQCDDGDGDPNTSCSYVDEFEQVAFDRVGRSLYVINTVNTLAHDRPAVFRLRKGACAGCFTVDGWRPLPLGPGYNGIVAALGELYVVDDRRLYPYDYDANQVATVNAAGDSLPPTFTTPGTMLGLSFDGTYMWILTGRRVLHQVEWATMATVQSLQLNAFNFSAPRGLEVVRDTIYVLEGDAPNPIYLLTWREP